MKIIKKREYNNALKIIKLHEEQIKKTYKISKVFGFLWFNKNGKEHNKYIKAKNIKEACRKFLKNKPKTIVKIDYEVHFKTKNNSDYISISNRKEFENYF